MLVCVIDDDAEDVELFSEALKDVDPRIEFIEFHKIPTALQHLRDLKSIPSHIFLDAHLPSGNSMDLIYEIKKVSDLSNVKIYIYSGFVSDAERTEFKKVGATDVITKPNQFNELRALLSKLLHK